MLNCTLCSYSAREVPFTIFFYCQMLHEHILETHFMSILLILLWQAKICCEEKLQTHNKPFKGKRKGWQWKGSGGTCDMLYTQNRQKLHLWNHNVEKQNDNVWSGSERTTSTGTVWPGPQTGCLPWTLVYRTLIKSLFCKGSLKSRQLSQVPSPKLDVMSLGWVMIYVFAGHVTQVQRSTIQSTYEEWKIFEVWALKSQIGNII